MGSIVPIDADGHRVPKGSKVRPTRYVARWRTPDGKSREQWFPRKVDAEQHLTTVENSKLEGGYVDQSAGRTKFKEYAEAWAARQPHRASTAQSVAMVMGKHIVPTFGHRPIAQITTSEVQAWVTGLSKDLAPSTVATVYQKLTAIFRAAVDDRVIARTPCTRGVKLPRPDGGEITPMTPAEVRQMVEAVPERYTALIVLLAGTGLRPGEALGLTSDRVDWLRRTIRVDQQLLSIANHSPTLAPPKTPSSVRTIPVPQSVLDVLAHHVERYPAEDALIFHDENDNPIRRSALGHMWRRSAKRTGVTDRTPHDLRHYAASVLIDRGANVKAVQRHLGHASAKVTLDTYSHLWPDAEDSTRVALEAGLRGIVNDAEAVVGAAR